MFEAEETIKRHVAIQAVIAAHRDIAKARYRYAQAMAQAVQAHRGNKSATARQLTDAGFPMKHSSILELLKRHRMS